MSDDILFSMAWECGDKDCPVQWHQSNYWIYFRGKRASYSVDSYAGGDHDSIRARDLPTSKEVEASWLRYSAFVLDSGRDPLGEFSIQRVIKRKERWQFKLAPSIIGVRLLEARRAGKLHLPRELPEHVRRYLNLGPSEILGDFKNWDEFAEAVPRAKWGKWLTETLEPEYPRESEAIERDLRRAARKHLASKQASD